MSDADRVDLDRWLAERDAAALRAIVLRYSGKVFAVCLRLLGSAPDAEAVCRECFEALARFEATGAVNSLGAWLHDAAAHRCLLAVRARSAGAGREVRQAAAHPQPREPRWEDIADHVDGAITEVPEVFREPILAHFFENQSYAAIARVTGIPERTVSYRVEQGLDRLASALKRRGADISAPALGGILTDNLAHAEPVPETLAEVLDQIVVAHAAPAGSVDAPGRGRRALLCLAALAAVAAGVWMARNGTYPGGTASQTTAVPAATESASIAASAEAGFPPAEQPVDAALLGRVSGKAWHAGTEKPVPGVLVKARNESTGTFEFETTTGADGTYAFAGLQPAVKYVILAESRQKGYGAVVERPEVRLAGGESRAGIDIVVGKGGVISGRVLDKTASYQPSKLPSLAAEWRRSKEPREEALRALVHVADEPLPGVRVVLAEWHEGRGPGRRVAETITDGHGQYTFTIPIPPGSYAVWAEPPEGAVRVKEGHGSVFKTALLKPNEDLRDVDFAFQFDAVSVTGRVTDSAGRPVEGARAAAEPLHIPDPSGGDGFGPRFDTGPIETVTGENGQYRLDGLMPANIHEVWAFLDGGSLPRGGRTYAVRAHRDGYAPAEIVVPAIPGGLARTGMAFIEGFAAAGMDNDGMVREYSECLLPPGQGNGITGIDFVLQLQAVVSGRLVDSRGQALPESRVRMVYAEQPGGKPVPLTLREIEPDWTDTGESGVFRFSGVPAGIFLFEANSKAGGTQTARNAPLEVRAGAIIDGIEVVVESSEARGRLAGRVVDGASRQPVPKPTVRVTGVDSPGEKNPSFGHTAIDEGQGTFTVEGCSPGIATLWVAADGYPPVEVQVEVVSGQGRDLVIPLVPEGLVEGHISLNGVSARGRVDALRADGTDLLHPQGFPEEALSGDADDQGYYVIRGLPPGDYYIQACILTGTDATACFRQEWTTATVGPGHITTVNINVTGGAVIRGTLAFPDVYQSARVHLFEGHAEGLTPRKPATAYRLRLRACTDSLSESGPFEFIGLQPGTYTLTAFCHNHRGLEGADITPDPPQIWHTVLIAPAQVLDVDLAIEEP